MRITARAPNHLGDGVMALPALHALAHRGDLTIQAPAWGADLYRDVPATVVARGLVGRADVAVLFPPSFRAAWQARHAHRRIGVPGDWRRWLVTDLVRPGPHRRDTYAALVAVLGAVVEGGPRWTLRDDDPEVDVPAGHVGLNPISPSGETVMWPGFEALAERVPSPVFYAGPGERLVTRHPTRVGLPLPAFARALSRCAVFVSNDSGAAHFAAACGVPTVVVHASTTASRTGPWGALPVEGPDLSCRPCYRKRCTVGLGCMAIEVERVLDRVNEVLGG